jgi:hypothetical protein
MVVHERTVGARTWRLRHPNQVIRDRGALIGLGIEGEEGMEKGAAAGAAAAAEGVHTFSDSDAWDVVAEIPNDSAAALILLEHHWAVPLRDAIPRAGGFRISDGFISPFDLVAIGMLTAEEAAEMAAVEAAPNRRLGPAGLSRRSAWGEQRRHRTGTPTVSR